jgi:hypothetical protein
MESENLSGLRALRNARGEKRGGVAALAAGGDAADADASGVVGLGLLVGMRGHVEGGLAGAQIYHNNMRRRGESEADCTASHCDDMHIRFRFRPTLAHVTTAAKFNLPRGTRRHDAAVDAWRQHRWPRHLPKSSGLMTREQSSTQICSWMALGS